MPTRIRARSGDFRSGGAHFVHGRRVPRLQIRRTRSDGGGVRLWDGRCPRPHAATPGASSTPGNVPSLLTIYMARAMLLSAANMRDDAAGSEVPYGTLDLMVLKTLEGMGPLHGYGIARRIEQMAEGTLALNQGTIYPALLRLEQKGWITSEWGTSENNRRARFYSITRSGRKQIAVETDLWARTVAMMNRLLEDRS